MFENASERFQNAKSLFLIVKISSYTKETSLDIRPCDIPYKEIKKIWRTGGLVTLKPVCFSLEQGTTINDVLMNAAIEGVQIDFIEHINSNWKTFKLVDNVKHEVLWYNKDLDVDIMISQKVDI